MTITIDQTTIVTSNDHVVSQHEVFISFIFAVTSICDVVCQYDSSIAAIDVTSDNDVFFVFEFIVGCRVDTDEYSSHLNDGWSFRFTLPSSYVYHFSCQSYGGNTSKCYHSNDENNGVHLKIGCISFRCVIDQPYQ